MKMEIYKYLRNECMDIKRSVGAGGACLLRYIENVPHGTRNLVILHRSAT